MRNIETMLGLVACVWLCCQPVSAAPDRLNDDVPDAAPDQPGAFGFSYGRESIDVEGALNDERTAHSYYTLRYTFSPTTAVSFKLADHDLVGGLGLFNPLLDNQDGAKSYALDLRINMLNVLRTPADPANEVPFAAGSAFAIGLAGEQFQLDAGNLSRDETLLKAYLTYSTDLSEEMRAHTYFSTGRLSGDSHSGSVNRVAAGLDYDLIPGRRPLVLMANGVLDIYNFREPVFNTSRISRFDVGLRYRVAEDWYASAGWVTINDSENNASGSGLFAGINYVSEPPDPEEECEVVDEEVPEPVEEPGSEQANVDYPQVAFEQPPLMSADYQQPAAEDENSGGRTASTAGTADAAGTESGFEVPPLDSTLITQPAEPGPQPTPADAVFVRAGEPGHETADAAGVTGLPVDAVSISGRAGYDPEFDFEPSPIQLASFRTGGMLVFTNFPTRDF